jgi:hypothetical protein
MHGQALARPASAPRERHLDGVQVDLPQTMDGCRGPMAEEGARAEAQEGSEELRTVTQARMADRENVVVQPV